MRPHWLAPSDECRSDLVAVSVNYDRSRAALAKVERGLMGEWMYWWEGGIRGMALLTSSLQKQRPPSKNSTLRPGHSIPQVVHLLLSPSLRPSNLGHCKFPLTAL